MTLVYITCKDKEEARKISKALLEKKLIACSNMFPIESMYWWKGKIEEDNEVVILAKTKEKNYEKIKEEVKKLHSYEVPCILKLSSEANIDYDKWVDEVVM
jgi:periplasmic divalent cation tolerance protein